MSEQYYNRFDANQNYEEHRFIAGRGLQSAELNELQKTSMNRLRGISDALFKDGNIVRDAGVVVNPNNGYTQCGSGAIYIRGSVRGLAPATFTIPIVGAVAIGVRLIDTIVTVLEDPALRDPATGTRNYDEKGADRLQVDSLWAWDGDGGAGEFFPVYGVVDGIVTAKEPPPNLDSVTQALARYDRDSAGGMYVVSGMMVSMLDDVSGSQIYSIASGRARVYGYGIEYQTARRVVLAAAPDLLPITTEPKLSTTVSAQRINLDRTPATNITQVGITAEKTVTITHGVTTGTQDPLPDTSVLSLVEVKQGGTTYTPIGDYLLTSGKVDWSPAGAEPAPGSTYTVKYRYLTTVTPTAVDDNGFTVTGAVVGTLVLTTYSQKLPRIDRLCINSEGLPVWVNGISSSYYAQMPSVPGDLLPLASVYQSWDSSRKITNDGVRMVAMPLIAGLDNKIDYVLQLVAQQRLESNIHTREGGTKKGLFVDPFIDDLQRDAGTAQTAAVVNGELILPISGAVSQMSADIQKPETTDKIMIPSVSQLFKTTSMKINPYLSFAIAPSVIQLTPSVDRWTEIVTAWASPLTNRFVIGSGDRETITTNNRNLLLSSSSSNLENLRQIEVRFSASGFGVGETLSSLTFDGVEVTPLEL